MIYKYFCRHPRITQIISFESIQRQMRQWRGDGPQHFVFNSLREFHDLLHTEDWSDRRQYQEGKQTEVTLFRNDDDNEILIFTDNAMMRAVRDCTHLYVQVIHAVRPEFGFRTMVLQVTAIVKNCVWFF